MTVELLEGEVECCIEGRLGIITLNRPKALNALNLAMVERLDMVLADWAQEPSVDAILIRSASDRAFCAGGDVRSIGILPDPEDRMALGRAFFGAEYRVNYRINTFPKPYIALINGVAMGGGLGLSIHGSHRVVSENVRIAMPETVLGLFPDVGATWFLNRCPGATGRYLALVGPHLGAADALTAKLATHHIPFSAFPQLTADLVAAAQLDGSIIEQIIARHHVSPQGSMLAAQAAEIDRIFGGYQLNAVIDRVAESASREPWIGDAHAVLCRASPTSVRATWRRMIDGKTHSIEKVLADDFTLAVHMVGRRDFSEGVRAILVDKDLSAAWTPASINAVPDADIDKIVYPQGDEIWRPPVW